MLPYDVHRHPNRGVTLLEVIFTTVIVGILAAIAGPNLMQLLNENKVQAALDQLRGALQDAQRQSMRKSQQCTVNFEQDTSQGIWMVTGTPFDCLVSSDTTQVISGQTKAVKKLEKGVSLTTNLPGTPPNITFSFKGNTTNSGRIILSASNGSGKQRCLVISNGLGIMRTGIYQVVNGTGTCTTSM
jgi:prepilin-type N-terminal cleavage/methylation domain-containing protein